VSESSVRNAKAVLDYGDTELIAAVEAGQIGVREGADIARHPESFDAYEPAGEPAPSPPPEDGPESAIPTETPLRQPTARRASSPQPKQVGPVMNGARFAFRDLEDGHVATLIEELIEKRSGVRRALAAKPHVLEQLGGFEAARGSVSKWLRGERLDAERANFVKEAFNSIIEKATKERLLASLAGGPPINFDAPEGRTSNATDLSPELWARVRAGELSYSEAAKLAKRGDAVEG
jgi:hypothetical protein